MKKILLSQEDIQQKIRDVAFTITAYEKPDVILCALGGAVFFFADLVRMLRGFHFEMDYIKPTSFARVGQEGGVRRMETTIVGPLSGTDLKDKKVFIIEDIVDSGVTLQEMAKYLYSFQPKSLTVVSLLKRDGAVNTTGIRLITLETIPQGWVVGYGLDNKYGYERNLNYIYLETEGSDCGMD